MDKELKNEAERIFREVGVNASDALTMFYKQAILQQGLPFEVRIPNKQTRKAIADLAAGKGEKFHGTGKEIVAHLLK